MACSAAYDQVKENYHRSLERDDLKKCPEYWGGFSFTPYYFEFWEGHKSRINKREVFEKMTIPGISRFFNLKKYC